MTMPVGGTLNGVQLPLLSVGGFLQNVLNRNIKNTSLAFLAAALNSLAHLCSAIITTPGH